MVIPVFAFLVALATALLSFDSRAVESAPRLLAERALTLRVAGISGDAMAVDMLSAIPGARALPDKTLATLWSPFFSNAVVQPGRMQSSAPVALYLDPILDLAIMTYWRKEGDDFTLASAHALPGARLVEETTEVGILPPWLTGREDVVDALSTDMAERLVAFSRLHPADGKEDGSNPLTFAATAEDMRATLPRLLWAATQRERWTDGSHPWLPPVLAQVETALAARDVDALLTAAPDTNRDMARILAELPQGFVDALVLDMVLETQGSQRVLIGSLPDDGDVYVLALCNLRTSGETDDCSLQRLSLISLAG